MKKLIVTAAVAALFSLSAQAGNHGYAPFSAGYGYDHDRFDGDDDDDDGRYRSDRQPATEYADVLQARPIYEEVRISQPREECHDERVVYRDRYDDRDYGYNNAAGAVIGGVIGGAVGHQVSRGSGRAVATVIGAVIGSQIGQNVQRENQEYRRGSSERVAYEPRCRRIADTRYEQRIQSYDVTYRLHGRVYRTSLPYDPGNRLAVNVRVEPARY